MVKNLIRTGICATVLLAASQPASAETGDFLIRGRMNYVMPMDDSGLIRPGFGDLPSGASLDNSIGAEISVTYFLSNNFGVEFGFMGSKLDLFGDDQTPAQGKLASAKYIMPNATLQYHFMPKAAVRPYIGFGVNYIRYYDESPGSVLELADKSPRRIQPTATLEARFGYHGQIGFDIPLNDRVFFNIDVKYVKTNTVAKFVTNDIDFVDVDVDPFIFGAGFGFRF
jgi:outer membrane protein